MILIKTDIAYLVIQDTLEFYIHTLSTNTSTYKVKLMAVSKDKTHQLFNLECLKNDTELEKSKEKLTKLLHKIADKIKENSSVIYPEKLIE